VGVVVGCAELCLREHQAGCSRGGRHHPRRGSRVPRGTRRRAPAPRRAQACAGRGWRWN
jgi:hypothetical protein